MSKYLDKAIKEMKNYGDMGLPDGENGGGMGSQAPSNNKIVNAYKLNNILRRRQQAEEEETQMGDDEAYMDDKDYKMDMPGNEAGDEVPNMDGDEMGMDGDEMGMGSEVDTEEMKAFFQDNEAPSDEEVQQYADERGIDMEQMRQEVYALIQSLLGDSDPVGDGEEDMGMDDEVDMGDEIEFSAPMDGEEDEYDEEEEAKAPAERDRMKAIDNYTSTSHPIKNQKRASQNYRRLARRTTDGKWSPTRGK